VIVSLKKIDELIRFDFTSSLPKYKVLTMTDCCDYKHLLEPKKQDAMRPECLQASKRSSLLIGILVGCLIQSSTLGMSWIFFVKGLSYKDDGEAQMAMKSTIVIYLWSVLSAFMGVFILVLLRETLESVAHADGKASTLEKEEFLVEVYGNVEYFFTIGMVTSVSLIWCLTDHLLGLNSEACQCFGFLIFCLAVFATAAALSKADRKRELRALYAKMDTATKMLVV